MRNISIFQGISQNKCPQCRKGDIFESSALNISKFTKMHKNCQKCGLRYEVEPGFFFGAMYVSYGFSVAIAVACIVGLTVLVNQPGFWAYFLTLALVITLAAPFSFRLSRILWLYIFVKHKPE
jgi:uncharacterized protein (DUF983 family)